MAAGGSSSVHSKKRAGPIFTRVLLFTLWTRGVKFKPIVNLDLNVNVHLDVTLNIMSNRNDNVNRR